MSTTENFEDIPQDGIARVTENMPSSHETGLPQCFRTLQRKMHPYIFNADKMIFCSFGRSASGMNEVYTTAWIKRLSHYWSTRLSPSARTYCVWMVWKACLLWWKAKEHSSFARVRKNTIHPTMKPIRFWENSFSIPVNRWYGVRSVRMIWKYAHRFRTDRKKVRNGRT